MGSFRCVSLSLILTSLENHSVFEDGTPRSILIVKDQLDDYRTVIKWVRQQLEFDPQRVVLFGTSFSGQYLPRVYRIPRYFTEVTQVVTSFRCLRRYEI